MCVQGVKKQWAKERPRKLCFEEVARNCKESKVEAIPPSNENGMVSLFGLRLKVMQFFGTYINPTYIINLTIGLDGLRWLGIVHKGD